MLRSLYRRALKQAALAGGRSLLAAGTHLLSRGAPSERLPLPQPLSAGAHTFDVVEDLVAYTHLERGAVVALVTRTLDDFRREWHATPEPLRADDWYYLSSRMYLFGNAVHLHESPELLGAVAAQVPPEGRVLDFGGGTGNLALALAALGREVDYLELSALQKDFVRFRAARHGLGDRVTVRDAWEPLPRDRYDLVCALDVLEHLPDLQATLTSDVLPALKPGGALVEQSPFGASSWNPMHHPDPGLDRLLREAGLEPAPAPGGLRCWRAGGG